MQFRAAFLWKPVDASGLGLFRTLFGLVLAFQAIEFIRLDFVRNDLSLPVLHYPFPGFEFLPVPTGTAGDLVMLLLLVSGLLIAFRVFHRAALSVYLLLFTWIWLVDRGYFNNHYYLVSILCLMLLLMDEGKWTPWRKQERVQTLPAWQPLALRTMFLIVFFWSGLNKLQHGWLVNHQPIAYILDVKAQVTGNAAWDSSVLEALLIYGGVVFDLAVIPLLWWRKTRLYAFIGMLAFNGFNFWLFHDIGEIGVFPWLVLAGCSIFAAPDFGRRIVAKLKGNEKRSKKIRKEKQAVHADDAPGWRAWFIGVFLLFQALWPARHLLIPGHVDWRGEGQRFAWRRKIVDKDFDMHFFTVDNGGAGPAYEANLGKMLTPKQYTALAYYPDLIPPTARFLRAEARKQGMTDPVVRVDFTSGLNGGPRRRLLSADTDASRLRTPLLGRSDWILDY